MQIKVWQDLTADEQQAVLTRPAQTSSAKVEAAVHSGGEATCTEKAVCHICRQARTFRAYPGGN